MNRIILDHLKRWSWLWLIVGIANGFLAGAMADDKLSDKALKGVMFPLILWAGAMQLNFDLQRGIGRALTALPVTIQQIGRAWWIFSVALPAILLATTTGLGLMIHSAFSNQGFQLRALLMTAAANALFLGAMFTLFVGEIQGAPSNAFGWLRRLFSIGVIMVMVMFFLRATWNTPEAIFVLSLGLILTVAGWFRAEQMVVQRATFRPGIQTSKRQPGQYQSASGFGGLPFLVQTLFIRVSYMGIAAVAWLLVMRLILGGTSKLSPQQLMEASLPAFSSFGFFFVFMFLLLPLVTQLRHLRSLPISTSALAAVLVLMPAAPIFLIGLARAIYGVNFSDGANIFYISSNFFTSAAMMSATAPLFVWQGLRNGSYFLFFFLMLVASMGLTIFYPTKIPESVIVSISLGVIVAAFFATRQLLKTSSRAYRPPAASLAGYGGGR